LTLCQSAAATAPVAVPQQIVGNNDETAILLLALANDAGDELARRAPGGWVSMIREFNFQSVAVLPQPGTVANVGNSAVISGLSGIELVSPDLWIAAGTGIPNNAIIRLVEPPITMSTPTPNKITLSLKSSVTGPGTFQFGQANYPLPADFDRPVDNTFWDRSRYWAMRGPLSPQQWQIYKSSVIGRASIQRRFRFRSVYSQGGTQVGGSIGTEGVGDVPAFRTFEYLIRLSLKYRLLRRLGLSYNEELDEYERQVSKALATDGGAPILNMTPMDGLHLIGPFQLPETGYGPQTGQP
jgi:hypothetical protein